MDFVVTYGGGRHLPIEVKLRRAAQYPLRNLSGSCESRGYSLGVVVTGEMSSKQEGDILYVPLRSLLLIG